MRPPDGSSSQEEEGGGRGLRDDGESSSRAPLLHQPSSPPRSPSSSSPWRVHWHLHLQKAMSAAARRVTASKWMAEEEEDDDDDNDSLLWSTSSHPHPHHHHHHPPLLLPYSALLVLLLATGWLLALAYIFPFPTTVHLFITLSITLVAWTAIQLYVLARHALRSFLSLSSSSPSRWHLHPLHQRGGTSISRLPCTTTTTATSAGGGGAALLLSPRQGQSSLIVPRSWSICRRIAVFIATVLSFLLLCNSTPVPESKRALPTLHPSREDLSPEKYFIAANLYNNDASFGQWSKELLALCQYLGTDNVFISIAESNSEDRTKFLLEDFGTSLDSLGIPHRISLENNADRWWPYGTSPERVTYLAGVRNKAMEPLQSPDDKLRLVDNTQFTKIIFLNDIFFTWQGIIRLLATRVDGRTDLPGDYDLACAMDFGSSGLYDSWVARDACGNVMRPLWPYAKDQVNIQSIAREEPFEVTACWNGVTAFPAGPYVYKKPNPPAQPILSRRGWRMMDNASYPHTLHSPPLPMPLRFRGVSYTDPCDHSECFLFSYDLHRLYNATRPPRIYMNPTVKVAYDRNWFMWHNVVLRIPAVDFWLRHWSRGKPLAVIDWILEAFTRKRDYCTWAGLQLPDRCDPLPGPVNRGWAGG